MTDTPAKDKSTNNNRRNRGRGGRGKGRNRGRGQGRGGKAEAQDDTVEASNPDKTKEDSTAPATNPTAKESKPSVSTPKASPASKKIVFSQSDNWFLCAVTNLGHFDPSSVARAINVEQDPKMADSQLVSLTLWLEDRVIRSWNLEARENLRKDFWSHINDYLDALECPKDYFPLDYYADEDKEFPHWRYSSSHRIRVVNWLLSCATSEAFGDIGDETDSTKENTTTQDGGNTETTITEKPFSLGFSTGDKEVDHILTLLRMKLLIQLEEDQKAINVAVSEVQDVTAAKAKPLKQAKLRKHNINTPSPNKKSDNNNRSRGKRR